MTREMEQSLKELQRMKTIDYSTDLNRLRDDVIEVFKKVLAVMDAGQDPRLCGGWSDPHDARG